MNALANSCWWYQAIFRLAAASLWGVTSPRDSAPNCVSCLSIGLANHGSPTMMTGKTNLLWMEQMMANWSNMGPLQEGKLVCGRCGRKQILVQYCVCWYKRVTTRKKRSITFFIRMVYIKKHNLHFKNIKSTFWKTKWPFKNQKINILKTQNQICRN